MRKRILYSLLLIILLAGFTYAEVSVIINSGNSTGSLKAKDIKDIFTGKKTSWPDNSKIVFVTVKKSDVHNAFLKTYVKKSSRQYKMFWKKKVFTGEGEMPKTLADDKAVIDFVSKNKGAIGYISSAPSGNVKKLSVK